MADTAGRIPALPASVREEARSWTFVAKSLVALYLTAWLAMRLELQQPSTAMLSVAIVMQPQNGLVLAKSFYRILGTIVGSIVGLVLIAAFAQEREFFLFGLCAWVSLCAVGALLYRNFMAYGYVLAGYTAAIVSLPSLRDPLQGFQTAQMRVSEVLLGITVATLVSALLWPQRLGPQLYRAAQERLAELLRLIRDGLQTRLPPERAEHEHLQAVRAAVSLEDLRSSVIFEDPEVRANSNGLRHFNHQMMAVSTTFQSLIPLRERLPVAAAARIDALGRELAATLATPSRLAGPRARLEARAMQLRQELSDPADLGHFDAAAALLLRLAGELRELMVSARLLRARRAHGAGVERVHFQRSHDPASAWKTGLRTFGTMITLSGIWIVTAWPSGGTAMLVATVFSALMAIAPNPVDALTQTLSGFAIAAVLAIVVAALLPGGGFPGLVAVTLPLLAVLFYLGTRPRWAGVGMGAMLGMFLNLQISNPMRLSTIGLFNGAVAEIVGLLAAVLGFALLPVRGSMRRALARLRATVDLAASAPLDGLASRFESVHRDLLSQLLRQTATGGHQVDRIVSWSLVTQEIARALIELRQDLHDHAPPAPVRIRCDAVVGAVAALFRSATPDRQAALDAIARALDAAPPAPLRAHLLQLRIALQDPRAPIFVRTPLAPVSHASRI